MYLCQSGIFVSVKVRGKVFVCYYCTLTGPGALLQQ